MRKALFVGRHYVDIPKRKGPVLTDNQKHVTRDWAISFIAGNGVSSAFACRKLGGKVDLLSTVGQDEFGIIFVKRAREHDIQLHQRHVAETSVSIIDLEGGDRTIERLRKDDSFLREFPPIEPEGFFAFHSDGHQADASVHYAQMFQAQGRRTSLDLGTVRTGTEDLLHFVDVVSAAEDVCADMGAKDPRDLLDKLHARGRPKCLVTLGKKGRIWCEEDGVKRHMNPFSILDREIVDGCNAGDFHNGARVFYHLENPEASFEESLRLASAVASQSLRHMGCEQKLKMMVAADNIRSMLAHRPVAVTA